jgi:malate dehydrogenase
MVEPSALTVCVTGAAGQIGYSILPMICSGQMLGYDQRIDLALLDIPQCEDALRGVVMEISDSAFPLLNSLKYGSDPREILKDLDIIIFLGGFPRKAGMERKELLQRNMNIFKEQGTALNEVGKPTTLCLVVANPANTNCLVLAHHAPNIPRKNFTAMTRLDHNRSSFQIANKVNALTTDVKNIAIWGNHSSTQYPDVNHGTVHGNPIRPAVNDDEWLNGPFITCVQKRGAAIIEARKLSSAMSAAKAAVDHVRDWVLGSKEGEWVSMGVISDGSYGIDEGLCYSFPCRTSGREWHIVQGLEIDEFSRGKMEITKRELIEERDEALSA